MSHFAPRIPSTFSGLPSLQPRNALLRPSAEEQYFRTLAEEHERAADFARQQLLQTRQRQQQHELEAQLRLQQQLAASVPVRTPTRSAYRTSTLNPFASAPPGMTSEFGAEDGNAYGGYAEHMHRRSQIAALERQKRAEEQSFLRALVEEQRRTQAEQVTELHCQRAEQAKVQRERAIKAQREAEQEQASRHLRARAVDEEALHRFFQALVAMSAESQGANLEHNNAVRRDTDVPIPTKASPNAPARAVSPTHSTASNTSASSLSSIVQLQNKYATLRSSFSLPADLVFAPSSPSLLYSTANAPVHTYENALTGLLTELDAVESFGDDHVREVRRSLARSVEAELESLEEKKREAWKAQRESAPVPMESVPAPVDTESAPVESTPVPAPTPTFTTDTASSLAWLTAQLAQQFESEDDELKSLREGLLARLTVQPAVESVAIESSVPLAIEVLAPASVEAEPTPVESARAESITPTPEPAVPNSPPQPESEPEVIEHTPAESAIPFPTVASEPVISTTEPELEDTTPTEPEHTTATESETTSLFPAPVPDSESAPNTFVRVFPDSDSDSEDLASELVDKKSTSGGDEFEIL